MVQEATSVGACRNTTPEQIEAWECLEEVVQREGDVLFLPRGWYHAVRS